MTCADGGGFLTDALDPNATAMRGAGAYLRLGKDAGNWMWETAMNVRTPGFESNDLAFLTRADYLWYNANVFRYWSKPTKYYRDLSIIVGGQEQQNFDGDITDRQFHSFVGTTATNFWNFNLFYIYRPDLLDDRLLRGGPVVEKPSVNVIGGNMGTDSRGRVSFHSFGEYAWNRMGGYGRSIGAGIDYRPAPNATSERRAELERLAVHAAIRPALPDATNTEFYGQRYVLASIDQKQLILETRLSWTFSPTTSFELFAQPLLASGDYFDYKEYDRKRTSDVSIYGRDKGTITETPSATPGCAVDHRHRSRWQLDRPPSMHLSNPDFNFRSLRGNAVFRWEFRPGIGDVRGLGALTVGEHGAGRLPVPPRPERDVRERSRQRLPGEGELLDAEIGRAAGCCAAVLLSCCCKQRAGAVLQDGCTSKRLGAAEQQHSSIVASSH